MLMRAAALGRLRADGAEPPDDAEPPDGAEPSDGAQRPPVGVVVAAPARYQAADFIAYLFTELCLAVLGGDDPDERSAANARVVRAALAFAAGATAIAAGVVALTQGTQLALKILLGAAAGAGAIVVMLALVSFRDSRGRGDRGEARRCLHELRNLDTVSRGVSGAAGPTANVGGSFSVSSAEQAATWPELVRRYERFVKELAGKRQVIVGIDELDKMTDKDARRFLNHIKTLFGQRNCFYLVSVSEDAMSAFERRGMPFRDVFDSSFDTVLRVEPLTTAESAELLDRRVVGMGLGAQLVCHAFSGGMPRDLIRAARSVVERAGGGSVEFGELLAALAVRRIRAAELAAATVARRFVLPDGTQPLLEWIAALPDLQDPGAGNLDRARVALALRARFQASGALAHIASCQLSDSDKGQLQLLAVEFALAAYHADTIVEFFDAADEGVLDSARRRLAQLRAEASARPADPADALSDTDTAPAAELLGNVELLAHARQQMMSAPKLAWDTLSKIRASAESYPTRPNV
jgi:hypothetical protein